MNCVCSRCGKIVSQDNVIVANMFDGDNNYSLKFFCNVNCFKKESKDRNEEYVNTPDWD